MIKKILVGISLLIIFLASSTGAAVHLDGVPLAPIPPTPKDISIEARIYTIRLAAAHAKATPGTPPTPVKLKIVES